MVAPAAASAQMKKNAYLSVAAVLVVGLLVIAWWSRPAAKVVTPASVNLGTLVDSALLKGANTVQVAPAPGTAVQTPGSVPTAAPTVSGSVPPVLVGAVDAATRVNGGQASLTVANSPPPSVLDGMVDLDKTRRMIRDYRTLMGENPVGTNAEIMKAVMGDNSRQATVGPGEGQQLNSKGELVDQWGTPYFFHQLSGTHMEIHSAGPDRIMGTDDDLILK